MTSNELWIGLVNVIPKQGNDDLGDSSGAYVNVISYASSSSQFCKLVKKELLELGFIVVEIEDIELFSDRIETYSVSDELFDLAREVESSKKIGLGTFHSYKNDESLN